MHLDYFRAGADIAITASYQASIKGLEAVGYDETESLDLIKKSAVLAREARKSFEDESNKPGLLVAGSIGPFGAYLNDGSEYTGDYELPFKKMKDFHRPRMKALLDADVDLLAIETLPSFPELQALLSLLSDFPTATAYVSFTTRDSDHLSDGTAFIEAVTLLNEAQQVLAIGVNCIEEDKVTGALATLGNLTTKPLIVYPNSGQQYDVGSNSWTGENALRRDLAHKVATWHSLGARIIGGCCQTSPQDIRIMSQALKRD